MSTDEQSVKDEAATVAWEEIQQNLSQCTTALREMRSLQENLGYQEQHGLLVDLLLGCLFYTK